MAYSTGNWFKLTVRAVIASGVLLLLAATPWSARAAEVMITPSVNVGVVSDSNATSSRTNQRSDVYTRINPKLATRYATERFRMTFDTNATALRYMRIADLNAEYYGFNGSTEYALTERLNMNLGGSVTKDSTLRSDIEETTQVYSRQDRRRWSLNGGLGYALTEQSNLRFAVGRGRTQYDDINRVDSEYLNLSSTYSYRLDNAKDVFSVQPYFTQSRSRVSTSDSYGLTFGLEHPFNEIWTLSTFAGARYTDTKFRLIQSAIVADPTIFPIGRRIVFTPVDQSESDLGWTADIGLKRKGERHQATLRFNRDLSYSSLGEPIDTNKLTFNLAYDWTERLSSGLDSQYYIQKSSGDISKVDRVNTSINPFIRYNINRDAFLRLAYDYTINKDKTLLNDNTTERHSVTLSFEISAPRQY